MLQTDKKIILFIGKTHSGKTTLAKKLQEKVPGLLVLEADPIAAFMKEEFPVLREADDREHTGVFKDTSLKFKVFLLFVEFAISLNKQVLLSNSNMWKKGRAQIFELCKKYNLKTVGVYFNYPEEVLRARIETSGRSTNILHISKNFDQLLTNQKDRMQVPESSEFDEFYTVESEAEALRVTDELLKIL